MIDSSFLRIISRGGYSFAADMNTGRTYVGRGSISSIGTATKSYGKWGGAATLSGTQGFVLPSFNLGPGYSFGIRAKWTATTASMTLLDFSQSTGGGTVIYARVNEGGTGKINIAGISPLFNAVSPASTYNDGLWHSVVGVWGPAGVMNLHIDGVSVATASATVPRYLVYDARAGVEYWFGTNYSYFNGTLADPFMCNTILTGQEIRSYHTGTIEQGQVGRDVGKPIAATGGPFPHFQRRLLTGGMPVGAL